MCVTGSEFVVGAAVWARVEPHPWWPAKVVRVASTNQKTVYTVAFFAQRTEAFLYAHHLRPLAQTPDEEAPEPASLPQLHAALQMAHLHQAARSRRNQQHAADLAQLPQLPSFLPQNTEEMGLQNIVKAEGEGVFGEAMGAGKGRPEEAGCVAGEITAENVLEMIARNRRREKASGYSYETRKEEMQLQAELKRHLLLRFNLLHLDDPAATAARTTPPSAPPAAITTRNYRRLCRGKGKALMQGEVEMLRGKCMRRVRSLLRGSERREAERVVRRIMALADGSRVKLQSLFVTLVKALAATDPLLSCEDRLAEFSSYLEQLETDKHEDEGSKITQIDVPN